MFSKLLITLASVHRFPYWNPQLRLDLQSQRTISLLFTITISLNIQMDKFVHRSVLEKTILCFSIKKIELHGNKFIPAEIENLNHREIHHLYKNGFYVASKCENLRAITIYRAFTPDCGYDKSTNILIGDVYCPNTKCSCQLCLHKKTFQSLGRSDYQCPRCAYVYQVRNIPFEDQTNYFFLSFGQGAYNFEEIPKSVQDVIGDVYCPGKYCFNREQCEFLGGYVTTPRSIYSCGKYGA